MAGFMFLTFWQVIVVSSASYPSGVGALGFQYSKNINTFPLAGRVFLVKKVTDMDACFCPMIGDKGDMLADCIPSAVKPSTIPPTSDPF